MVKLRAASGRRPSRVSTLSARASGAHLEVVHVPSKDCQVARRSCAMSVLSFAFTFLNRQMLTAVLRKPYVPTIP
jgi:hypothetical protein